MTRRASFSISRALEAPFVLLRRRPASILAWGGVQLLLAAAMIAAFLPLFAGLPFEEMAADTPPPEAMRDVIRFQVAAQGMNLIQLFVSLILWTAALRAGLSPKGPAGLAFLRLGMDELRVAVVTFIAVIGVYLGIIALVLIGAALGLAVWSFGEGPAVIILVLYGLAVTLAALWILGRLLLIAPASLMLHRFAFSEGWALGRGQGWKLLVTAILTWIIFVLIYVVVALAAIGFFWAVSAAMGTPWPTAEAFERAETPVEAFALMRPFLIPAVVASLPLILFSGFSFALWAAPLASAVRQLADSAAPPPEAAPDAKTDEAKTDDADARVV